MKPAGFIFSQPTSAAPKLCASRFFSSFLFWWLWQGCVVDYPTGESLLLYSKLSCIKVRLHEHKLQPQYGLTCMLGRSKFLETCNRGRSAPPPQPAASCFWRVNDTLQRHINTAENVMLQQPLAHSTLQVHALSSPKPGAHKVIQASL